MSRFLSGPNLHLLDSETVGLQVCLSVLEAAERNWSQPLHQHCAAQWGSWGSRGIWEWKSEVEFRIKECVALIFFFFLTIQIYLKRQEIELMSPKSSLLSTETVKLSTCLYLDPQAFSYFLPLSYWEGRVRE